MSESKQQHAPLPWHGAVKDVRMIVAADGARVADCAVAIGMTPEEQEANAKLIFRAVNSHEALVEALRRSLPKCDQIVDRDVGTPCGAIAVWASSFSQHYCDEHHKVDHHPMKVALAGREALVFAEKES